MYFYVPFAIFSYSNSTVTVPNACPNPYEGNLTVAYNNVSLSLSGLSQNTDLHWGIDQCYDSGTNIYNLKDESVSANHNFVPLPIQLAGLSALELSRFIESLEYLSQLGTAINILSLATSFVNCQHVTTDDPNGIVFTNDSKPAYDLNIPDNTTYNVYCPNGGGEGHTAYINTTGCYSVDGLYLFRFNPNTFGTPGCINLSSTNVLNCEPIQSEIHYKSAKADIHIPIVPAHTISGNVCEDGKVLSGQNVKICDKTNNTAYVVTTGSTGNYRFFAKPDCNYLVSLCSYPDYSHCLSASSTNNEGGNTSVNLIVPPYTAQFTESGLPPGTEWSVDLAGDTQSTTSSSIVFDVPNGSYSYSVDSSGYTASPSSGTIQVDSSSVT
jgi:hypothetical protein